MTTPGGYAFQLDGGSIDAERFERLTADAAEALTGGNPSLALSQLERALALWRGPAYADVMYDDFARMEVERLDELRLDALERRLEASLQLGRHADVLGESLALGEEHPLRERVQGLAMLALYRAGRQAEALERYAEFRSRLDAELGLEPSVELRELQRRILQQDPALDVRAPLVEHKSGLPLPPNPLVGRTSELAALDSLLTRREVRLLVLTGAGGSGKTRLALAAASRVAGSFANGAVVVDLSSLRDPALVGGAIARALGISGAPGELSVDHLADAIRPFELLLLLDNLEHLRASAPLLVELLARAPRVTVLATSRVVLHVSGEHVFPVPPLALDDAAELFRQRAQALYPDDVLSSESDWHVREICRRIDGLPLAVELAATWSGTLAPATLLERLDARLGLLTRGPRDLPERQQTLRRTIDWSVGLLSDEERTALARLSVFRAGATIEAAEAVCETHLDVLSTLVDHHLVRRTVDRGRSRLWLLETIHEYAAELLIADPRDADQARARLVDWCLELVAEAEPHLSQDAQSAWLDILETEHDNLRAALDLLEAGSTSERRLALAVSLSRFWYVRGYLSEGRRRLEGALEAATGRPPEQRRRAFTAAASLGLLQGDHDAATRFAEQALVAAREVGNQRFVANALSNLGAITLAAGDGERAAATLEEAVELARAAGDERIAALAINNLGDLALTVGDYDRAEPLLRESLALLRARGDTANVARSLFNNGAVDLMQNRVASAADRFRESLALCRTTGDREDSAWSLLGLAATDVETGDAERAAILLGAARTVLSQMGADFKPFERHLDEATEARSRELLGAPRHEAAVRRGASLTLEDALDLATPSQREPI